MSGRNNDVNVNFEPATSTGANGTEAGKDDRKIQKLQEHVDQVSNIMQQNIDKIMERGTNLGYLEDRSEMLSSNANDFQVGSRRLSRKMWWQNMKINIIIGSIILIIVVIIIVSVTTSK